MKSSEVDCTIAIDDKIAQKKRDGLHERRRTIEPKSILFFSRCYQTKSIYERARPWSLNHGMLCFLCHFMWGSKWWKSAVISSFLQNFTENWVLIIPLIAQSGRRHLTLHPQCLTLWSNLNVASSECSLLSRHQIKTPDKKLPIQMFLVLPPFTARNLELTFLWVTSINNSKI